MMRRLVLIVLFLLPVFLSAGEIHDAARANDLPKLRKIVEKNPTSINETDGKGYTAFRWAAYDGRTEVARYLLSKGANPNTADLKKRTPLIEAATNGYTGIVELLLQNRVDVNAADAKGHTALYWALMSKHNDIFQILSKASCVEVIAKCGTDVLHIAASRLFAANVEALVFAGADVNSRDSFGRTSLHYAIIGGLPQGGYQPPKVGVSLTVRLNIMNFLIEHAANIDATDSEGKTALHWAVSRSYSEEVSLLLDKVADFHICDTIGLSPVFYATRDDIFVLMLERGSDTLSIRATGLTPLHHAAINGLDAGVEWLLDRGANIEAVDSLGETALHKAARNNHPGTVGLLLERGANMNALDKKGLTSIGKSEKVLINGKLYDIYDGKHLSHEVVKILIDAGMTPNPPGNNFETPLLGAVCDNDLDFVKELFKKGADINAVKDRRGPALLTSMCGENANPEIRDYLLKSPLKNPASPSLSNPLYSLNLHQEMAHRHDP